MFIAQRKAVAGLAVSACLVAGLGLVPAYALAEELALEDAAPAAEASVEIAGDSSFEPCDDSGVTDVFTVGAAEGAASPSETTEQGYALTGKNRLSDGMMVANAGGEQLGTWYKGNGVFAVPLTSYGFDAQLQRYYLISVGGHVFAKLGFFTVGSNSYYGREDQGCVVRGGYATPDNVTVYANNDGVVTSCHQNISWAGQPNNFFCAPTSGYMILSKLGAWRSVEGDALNIENVATYMHTRQYHDTIFWGRAFQNGINRRLGKDLYTSVALPSYNTVRAAILRSFENGCPVEFDTQEYSGGPNYNGHNNATFTHSILVEAYDFQSDAVLLVDPGAAGAVWGNASKYFWYGSLRDFVAKYLGYDAIHDDKEHVGIIYAK